MPILSDDDPHWTALRAEHQAKHGAAIAYIKRLVGEGIEYSNEVARIVLSEAGAYYELTEMPEEFVGALGKDVSHRLIADLEAMEMMDRLEALVRDVVEGRLPAQVLSLYVLYPGGSLRSQRSMFVFDHRQDAPAAFSVGALVPRGLPRAFKLRLQLPPERTPAGLPAHGTVIFLAPSHMDGRQCLLASITRTAEVRDLSVSAGPPGTLRSN